MKKLMILAALTFIGFTAMAQERSEATSAKELIPVYATFHVNLPYGPEANLWITTSEPVGTTVTYTVRITGHTNDIRTFTVSYHSTNSGWVRLQNGIVGRARIIDVSPESDGIYNYTAAIDSEIDW